MQDQRAAYEKEQVIPLPKESLDNYNSSLIRKGNKEIKF